MANSMRAVMLKKFGGVEELFIGSLPKPTIKKNEILLKVMHAGVNRMDILQRYGKYPPPPGDSEILGPEAAGTVEESNSEKFKKGEKVMALLPGGGYAEYAAVHESLCMPIPPSLSVAEAACVPEVWLTAYQLLHKIGGVKDGDNILIHAGASGVGTAAIQFCKLANASSVIVTTGSNDKILKCKKLGATHGLNYKEMHGQFASEVLNITNGKGADIILDCIGASYFEENMKSCGIDCRWILYGLMGGANVANLNLQHLLAKRINLSSTTLRSRSLTYRAELIKNFTQSVLPQFETSALKVICDSIYKFSEVQKAHLRVEKNENFGKVILQNEFYDGEK